ncbi:MAG TPA: preprotein translocase subunit YajC [Actinomycetes bacterium]|nr:preprotein translocase subunit YajC [Actinomycetes bacterium]
MEAVSALFPFALILAAFYLLIIRPARNRQRAAMQLQSELQPGLDVMTTSGMYGRVAALDDDSVSLEVSPGVTVRVTKAAVGRILSEPQGTGPAEATDTSNGSDDR